MRLPDVNVLVAACRLDHASHETALRWLTRTVETDERLAIADQVLASVIRVVTNRRVFVHPSTVAEALGFADALRSADGVISVAPGARHWAIFSRLLAESDARGGLVTNAWLAALAVESGCELVTFDRDFARFPGLRWSLPVA